MGDPRAMTEFGGIVESLGGQALALALNIVGNREDAEDAVQESFIQVYRNLAHYDPARSLKTWVFTIVFRRCLDVMKKRRRFFAAFERAKHEMPLFSNPGTRRELPSDLLAVLTARERTALALWANEGASSRDISQVLACSESTARVTLFNARKKIRSLLENRHASLQNG